MAKQPANKYRAYIDGYDVSGFLNAGSLAVEQETPVVTTFADAGPRRVVGSYDHNHSHGGFIDTANDSFDEIAFALLQTTTDHYLAHCWEGVATEGNVVYEAVVQLTSQPRAASVGEAITINLDAAGSNHLARGVILRSATISGTGNGTGQNLGVTTTGQIIVATFRVISGTFTSITMLIEESQNDGGGDAYATLGSLTSGSMTAAGVVRVTHSTASEAWKRVRVSAFSGTSCVVLVTLTMEAETV